MATYGEHFGHALDSFNLSRRRGKWKRGAGGSEVEGGGKGRGEGGQCGGGGEGGRGGGGGCEGGIPFDSYVLLRSVKIKPLTHLLNAHFLPLSLLLR